MALTNKDQIAITWYEGANTAGTPVIDYRVWYTTAEDNSYQVLVSNQVDPSYTAAPLVTGTTYLFKVQARNSEGYGAFSNEVSILAAQAPDQVQAPTTAWIPDYVVVTWTQPESNGAEITSYTIWLRSVDLSAYYVNTAYCDGSDPTIFAALQCTIPVAVFKTAPFDLPWGSSVFAKVEASNSQGTSVESNPGNGASIITTPDAPVNLVEQTEYRTKSVLSIAWEEGSANGGTTIIDYRVSIAEQG